MESGFGRIKDEMFEDYNYTSVAYFVANLMAFIDCYNCERPQESPSNLSPIEYRQQLANSKLLKAGKSA